MYFWYFSSKSCEFFVIQVINFLILFQNFSYFFISLFSLVGTSFKYLFLLIYSKYPFTLFKIRYKGFPLLSFTLCHLYNVVNIFVWIFIYFNIIRIKKFYVDDIIEKVVCSVFYNYIFDFITHFSIYIMNT